MLWWCWGTGETPVVRPLSQASRGERVNPCRERTPRPEAQGSFLLASWNIEGSETAAWVKKAAKGEVREASGTDHEEGALIRILAPALSAGARPEEGWAKGPLPDLFFRERWGRWGASRWVRRSPDEPLARVLRPTEAVPPHSRASLSRPSSALCPPHAAVCRRSPVDFTGGPLPVLKSCGMLTFLHPDWVLSLLLKGFGSCVF